jgi:glyoxylase-like metal-dependent hydrolase (beta-lactamase superfamily II)
VNDDAEAARTSLARLEALQAELLLPGHGDPWPGSPADAVAAARAVKSRR